MDQFNRSASASCTATNQHESFSIREDFESLQQEQIQSQSANSLQGQQRKSPDRDVSVIDGASIKPFDCYRTGIKLHDCEDVSLVENQISIEHDHSSNEEDVRYDVVNFVSCDTLRQEQQQPKRNPRISSHLKNHPLLHEVNRTANFEKNTIQIGDQPDFFLIDVAPTSATRASAITVKCSSDISETYSSPVLPSVLNLTVQPRHQRMRRIVANAGDTISEGTGIAEQYENSNPLSTATCKDSQCSRSMLQSSAGLQTSLDAGMIALRRWIRSRSVSAVPHEHVDESTPSTEDLSLLHSASPNDGMDNEDSLQHHYQQECQKQNNINGQYVSYHKGQPLPQHDLDDDVLFRQRALSETDVFHLRNDFVNCRLSSTQVINPVSNNQIRRRRQTALPPATVIQQQQRLHSNQAPVTQQSSYRQRRRAFTTSATATEQLVDDQDDESEFQDGQVTFMPQNSSREHSIGSSGRNNSHPFQLGIQPLNQIHSIPPSTITNPTQIRSIDRCLRPFSCTASSSSRATDDDGNMVNNGRISGRRESEQLVASLQSAPLPSPTLSGISTVADDDNSFGFLGTFETNQQGQESNGHNLSNSGANNNNNVQNESVEDPDRLARIRWLQINRRFQLVIAIVAVVFSLLLFAILVGWVVLTSAFVLSLDKPCDIQLRSYFWLVTFQLVLDVFRSDIMRFVFHWDSNSSQQIPLRVIVYNVAYLLYALLVLRLGIRNVFFYDEDFSKCRETSPDFFNATMVFVSLSIAAWTTIICGYLLPFCVVACLLTCNGYNPASAGSELNETNRGANQAVFPVAYSISGAPPDCIDQIPVIPMSSYPSHYPAECCICMEEFKQQDDVVRTNCHHVFHKNCCREWLRQARTCPVCRDDIPTSNPPSSSRGIETTSSNLQGHSLNQPATFPIGPTGRPVVGILRMLQSVGGTQEATSIENTVVSHRGRVDDDALNPDDTTVGMNTIRSPSGPGTIFRITNRQNSTTSNDDGNPIVDPSFDELEQGSSHLPLRM